ncbi:hypothetical protein [Meiothermus granaticius]|uniref:Uncharacterized protein n=1 Tax=Meiothermus granaticius NBRC 107808 TaxID=1227551 RepID=A0A399F716_9DEIN|nr:hypothetical protein [Meiothermus granaticius]RIH90682.1 hypothetical protein Mgrana_03194 [Meiothermus granaticius NBRC 107808]GEM88464.1 hypothetical protein MGR01S_30890 [Meiothermus granaticius NBRC 107808]
MQILLAILLGMFSLPILQTLLGSAVSQTVNATMEKITDSTATGVQNTLSQVTGGVIPPRTQANTGGANLPQPNPNDQLSNRLTNPWLYVSLGVFGYVAVVGIKQLRGAGRDLGSGVRSVHEGIKEDLQGVD